MVKALAICLLESPWATMVRISHSLTLSISLERIVALRTRLQVDAPGRKRVPRGSLLPCPHRRIPDKGPRSNQGSRPVEKDCPPRPTHRRDQAMRLIERRIAAQNTDRACRPPHDEAAARPSRYPQWQQT